MKQLMNKNYFKVYISILLVGMLLLILAYKSRFYDDIFTHVFSLIDTIFIIPTVLLLSRSIFLKFLSSDVIYRYGSRKKIAYLMFEYICINSFLLTVIYFVPTAIVATVFNLFDSHNIITIFSSFFITMTFIQLLFILIYILVENVNVAIILCYLFFIVTMIIGHLTRTYIQITSILIVTINGSLTKIFFIGSLAITCVLFALCLIGLKKVEVK